jgi:hypothetical protein
MDDVRTVRPLRDIVGDVALDAQELVRGELTLSSGCSAECSWVSPA